MAVMSKEEEADVLEKRTVQQAQICIFLNLSSWLMMIPARPEMVLRVAKGDAIQASQILGGMTAGAAAFEFLVTGVMGRVSDKIGRKPMLLGCSLVCAAGRLLTFSRADGNLKNVVLANWLDRTFTGACFPAFFTVMSAALSDVVLGQKLAAHWGTIGAYAGAGVMFGPWFGAQVMGMTGNPKWTAFAAVITSLMTAFYVQFYVDETLSTDKRKEIDLAACSPFAFLEFFKKGQTMRTLATCSLTQGITSDLHDVKMVLLKTKLAFEANDIGIYMLGSGLCTMLGGVGGKISISKLGDLNHTTLCHIIAIANFYFWYFPSPLPPPPLPLPPSRYHPLLLICYLL
jgi:MFS family permease